MAVGGQQPGLHHSSQVSQRMGVCSYAACLPACLATGNTNRSQQACWQGKPAPAGQPTSVTLTLSHALKAANELLQLNQGAYVVQSVNQVGNPAAHQLLLTFS